MSQQDVEKLLMKYPQGLTSKQLTELSGLTRGTILKNLRDMKKWKELDWTGGDEYKPVYTLRCLK